MLRRKTLAAAAVTALAGSALIAGPASAATKTLTVRGGSSFTPGGNFVDNHRFTPKTITLAKGDSVRVVNRSRSGEPHSITFLRRALLPDSFADFESEDSPLAALGARLDQAHGMGEEGPTNPFVQDFQPVPEGGALEANGTGDSYFFIGKRGPTFEVTADKGRNLWYLCIIHPWMQAKIQVR